MRQHKTHIFAVTLCALALILACPLHASAKSRDWRNAPGETQKTNASHARATRAASGAHAQTRTNETGPAETNKSADATPAKDYDVPPVAVICADNTDRQILLKPDQSPLTACPKGRPVYLDFGVSTDWTVPSIARLPPPSAQHDGGGH